MCACLIIANQNPNFLYFKSECIEAHSNTGMAPPFQNSDFRELISRGVSVEFPWTFVTSKDSRIDFPKLFGPSRGFVNCFAGNFLPIESFHELFSRKLSTYQFFENFRSIGSFRELFLRECSSLSTYRMISRIVFSETFELAN